MSYFAKLWEMTPDERYWEFEEKIREAQSELFNDETLSGTMAETSAVDFDLSLYGDYTVPDPPEDEIRIPLKFTAIANEQLEDRIPCGRRIEGELVAVINDFGEVRFASVEAEVVDA